MSEMTRQFGVTPGTVANTATPDRNALYCTPEELSTLYGMAVNEGQVRFAQALINSVCCRPSLWVEEYEERITLPSDRQQCILSATPVVQILEAAGRYSYGRRDRRALNQINYDWIASMALWGSPPRYSNIDVNQMEYFPATGEVFLPTGFFLVPFTELSVRYMSGFVQVPDRVKASLAEILNNICARGVSDRIQFSVGRVSRQFSTSSYITPTALQLLEPFIVRALA